MKLQALALGLALPLLACDLASVVPTIASTLSRISIAKVSQCAKLETRAARAKCIGAHVGSVALDTALAEASGLIDKAEAANAPNGSESPLSDREEKHLARDLNEAMLVLESAVSNTM